MKTSALIMIFTLFCEAVSGFNILALFTHPGKSHFHVLKPLLMGLVEKGHNVTVISHFPSKDPIENYTDVSLEGTLPILKESFTFDDFKFSTFYGMLQRYTLSISLLSDSSQNACKLLFSNSYVKNLQQGQYDIVLIEQYDCDCGIGIAYKLKVPFIGITTHVPLPYSTGRIGMMSNPSYVPSPFLEYGTKPNIWQCIQSLFTDLFYKWAYYYFCQLPQHRLTVEYLGHDIPELEVLAKNMSLLLTYTYFPLNGALPLPPNTVEIGGLHLHYDKNNTLDKDLQCFLDEAKDGVILFSMGSMIRSTSWPLEKLDVFKSVFAKIPQKVLWKWEGETIDNITKNVRLMKWIPQLSVLQHRNVKGFITHAGMLGITEAVFAGVPVLVVPVFGEQFYNAGSAIESGLGVLLDIGNITNESVMWGLNEILHEKMQKSVKWLSDIWKNRPLSPMETAVHWIEHVAKYGGKHMRSSSADVPLIRYLLFDVIGLVLIIVLVSILILKKLMALCFGVLFRLFNNKIKTE